MNLNRLALENFRNIGAARLDFPSHRHFLVGPNGQGKSNLLEAIGLCGALRSFRSADSSVMIATGAGFARLLMAFTHERLGSCELEIELRGSSKKVSIDGEPLESISTLVGLFPVVVMHSGDLALLDGAPGNRRRYFDQLISTLEPSYLITLKSYLGALAGRNQLLKARVPDQAQLAAFEKLLSDSGYRLCLYRAKTLEEMEPRLQQAYAGISPVDERPGLAYLPNVSVSGPDELRDRLFRDRVKDAVLGSTRSGPHRDDFRLTLEAGPARGFASEGQKRGLVLALRLAQLTMIEARTGIKPIVLADDIIGELDPTRRERFWNVFDEQWQLFASGTGLPENREAPWVIDRVTEGKFDRMEGGDNA